jgi:hypothetical protein
MMGDFPAGYILQGAADDQWLEEASRDRRLGLALLMSLES